MHERVKAFLEGQMSKDKPTPLFAQKTYAFDAAVCHLFYTKSSFSVQYLFSTSLTTSWFKSFITVFKKKQYKWYLTIFFFFFFFGHPSPLHVIK